MTPQKVYTPATANPMKRPWIQDIQVAVDEIIGNYEVDDTIIVNDRVWFSIISDVLNVLFPEGDDLPIEQKQWIIKNTTDYLKKLGYQIINKPEQY